MTMPVQVVNGRQEGPVLFVSAAMHGDELNGTIKRMCVCIDVDRLTTAGFKRGIATGQDRPAVRYPLVRLDRECTINNGCPVSS